MKNKDITWIVVYLCTVTALVAYVESYSPSSERVSGMCIATTNAVLPEMITNLQFFDTGNFKSRILIDTKTGDVTLIGLTPDEASRMFWKSLTKAYPEIKAEIIREYEATKTNK